jgi:hypothetical protein
MAHGMLSRVKLSQTSVESALDFISARSDSDLSPTPELRTRVTFPRYLDLLVGQQPRGNWFKSSDGTHHLRYPVPSSISS